MLSVLNILDHHVVSKHILTGAGGGQEGIAGDLPVEQHQRNSKFRPPKKNDSGTPFVFFFGLKF